MSKKSSRLLRDIGIGFGIGVTTTAYAHFWLKKQEEVHADTILEKVKNAFLKEGPIEGSWILFEKETVQHFALITEAYRGGITKLEDNELVAYEFLADAQTGSILDIERIVLA